MARALSAVSGLRIASSRETLKRKPILNLKAMMVLGPKLRKMFGDAGVETGDDGADADHGAGADDDAEHGQETAQLMLADGGQRQADRRT